MFVVDDDGVRIVLVVVIVFFGFGEVEVFV